MSDRPPHTRRAPAWTAPAAARVQYAIVPVPRLSLDTVARRSGLHPDLVRRFVALGLVDAERDAAGRLVFAPTAPAVDVLLHTAAERSGHGEAFLAPGLKYGGDWTA
ncbi:hypothetical protein ACWDAZ_42420, partial [Streptomyces sp. NPDC001215]